MDYRLDNRVALVTGGSGGIGGAISLELAKAGAMVFVHYNSNAESARSLVADIDQNGGKAETIGADITSSNACEELIGSVIKRAEKLDILVNNAAINREGLFIRQKDQDMDYVFSVNLHGLIRLTRFAVKHMMKNRYGRLIHVSSPAATAGSPAQTLYSASKAAIHGFSKSLAIELGQRGITSNVIIPGIINTQMLDNITEERREFFLSRIPAGRFGEPCEVASAVRFLASDESQYISGAELTVTGGGSVL